MRFLVFFLLAIAAITAAAEDYGSERVCEPGKSFKSYCNSCKCSDEGRIAECTAMLCPPGVYNEDGSVRIPPFDFDLWRESSKSKIVARVKVICEPGRFFKKYCNTCHCSEDGTSAACTFMDCAPGLYNEDGSRNNEFDPAFGKNVEKHETNSLKMMCQPGRVFKKYCNTCHCSEDGTSAACTFMDCAPGLYNEDGSRNDEFDPAFGKNVEKHETNSLKMMCQPGRVFKKYCNTCHCSEDGTSAACTFMDCAPGLYNEDGSRNDESDPAFGKNVEKHETNSLKMMCQPGRVFKKYCNTCHCSEDGTSAACTFMDCAPGLYNEDGSRNDELDPAFGKNVEKHETNSLKMMCQPGRVFKKYCNTCHCSEDGTSAACTFMDCAPGLYNEDGSRNDELDPAFGKNVEKHETNSLKMMCQPGRVFKKYCNTCHCSEDGTSAACTFMDCAPGLYNEDGSRNDESDPAFGKNVEKHETNSLKMMCQPGRVFKKYCNTCHCSEDGTSAACTFMDCAPGLYNEDGSRNDELDPAFGKNVEKHETNSLKMMCQPGRVFKKYCNTCHCSEDGTSAACTFMDCAPGLYNEDGSRNDELDPTFGKNVEKHETNSLKMMCQPGRVFKKYCNTCHCSEDGTSAACTFMDCAPGLYNEDGSIRTDNSQLDFPTKNHKNNDPKVACEPGKTFKKACNTCTCLKDGTSALCTMMLCDV